jgi:glutamate-5-semialdehyde dehydrogenase
MKTIQAQCQLAYSASSKLGLASDKIKNLALQNMAKAILKNSDFLIKENKKDLVLGQKNNMSAALLDRLTLNEKRLKSITDSLKQIAKLPDPIGEKIAFWKRPNGLKITKVRVPLGVIGIIYEARPNVTADAIALCLKTGNSVVLRGSSSAYNSNKAITEILKKAAQGSGLDSDAIQLLEDCSREGVKTFLTQNQYLSVIIPRGGASLIKTTIENATVPTIETGVGNCHVYIEKSADLSKAKKIVINAKVQRPSVCNAAESLLVDEKIAPQILPSLIADLQKLHVEIRGCAKTKKLVPGIKLAAEKDWGEEFLDLIISVKIVSDINEAIEHINKYGTKHTEAIISENKTAIAKFSAEIDAAAIMVNASTRFTDGEEFGFGAEMGISTQKLHARGPMGLPELTSYKYIVEGNGQIRK